MTRSRKKRNKIKKNKYYIFLFAIFFLILFFIIRGLVGLVREKSLNQYEDEIVIVKVSDNEVGSFSLKELRKMSPDKFKYKVKNDDEPLEVEGISLEKLFYKLDIDVKEKTLVYVEDRAGNRQKVPMDAALEPSRIYLIYAINHKPIQDYKKNFGVFTIIDKNSNSSNDRIEDVDNLNIY